MAILKIKKYPEKILETKSEKISRIDGRLIKLSDDMLETMYFFKGAGLAANQVGELKRVFVADIQPDGKRKPMVLFNPEILFSADNRCLEEGCLSFPGITAKIKRADRIIVSGITSDEKEIKFEANGWLARVLQHEIDHLNGIVYIKKLNIFKRGLLKRKYFKVNRE